MIQQKLFFKMKINGMKCYFSFHCIIKVHYKPPITIMFPIKIKSLLIHNIFQSNFILDSIQIKEWCEISKSFYVLLNS